MSAVQLAHCTDNCNVNYVISKIVLKLLVTYSGSDVISEKLNHPFHSL